MKVMKFGGSSVADAVNITKVAEIVAKAARDDRCIVVLSAMQGTTDMLIDMGRTAERGDDGYIESLQEIEQRHRTAARILLGDNCDASEFIDAALIELASITEGVRRVRDLSPKTLDRILSFGEIASTKIFSAKLDAMGLSSEWVDSRRVIKTDPTYGKAIVDQEQTNLLIAEKVASTDAEVIVLPGFIASDAEGFTTTLGRGGSDYTAAIAAAAVGADVLEIWTDVGGMMTADPRIVRGVRHIPRINYREAMELSHFGAKVIYPPTIQPVMARGIPLWIRNTFEPDSPGTMIEPNAEDDADIIRGISTIDGISVLNLEGSGMVGVPGFSRRLFDVLARSQINVILITQSSSEHSICVAIE
jgi:bifunctional aspartokinase / homoserine dehydrogenase 1